MVPPAPALSSVSGAANDKVPLAPLFMSMAPVPSARPMVRPVKPAPMPPPLPRLPRLAAFNANVPVALSPSAMVDPAVLGATVKVPPPSTVAVTAIVAALSAMSPAPLLPTAPFRVRSPVPAAPESAVRAIPPVVVAPTLASMSRSLEAPSEIDPPLLSTG